MTDFLATLADRAFERAPVLRRRRPSLFEPGPDEQVPTNPGSSTQGELGDVADPAPTRVRRAAPPSRRDPAESRPDTPARRRGMQHKVDPPATIAAVPRPRATPASVAVHVVPPPVAQQTDRDLSGERLPSKRPEDCARDTKRVAPAHRVVPPFVEPRRSPEPPASTPSRRLADGNGDRTAPSTPAARVSAVPGSERSVAPPRRVDDTTVAPGREPTRPRPRDDFESAPASPLRPAVVAIARSTPPRSDRPRAVGTSPHRAALPSIHVTIGRIEVRATPAAASAKQPAKPVAPSLSLDEYLRSRGGGGR